MDLRLALVTFTLSACISQVVSQDKYSTKFDFLNVDQILKNNRLLKSYYKCVVDLGPCTQESYEFKRTIPDALKTRCQKCNPIQKKNARKVIEFVQKNKPEMWEGALKKYDPTGELTKDILTDPNFLGPPKKNTEKSTPTKKVKIEKSM